MAIITKKIVSRGLKYGHPPTNKKHTHFWIRKYKSKIWEIRDHWKSLVKIGVGYLCHCFLMIVVFCCLVSCRCCRCLWPWCSRPLRSSPLCINITAPLSFRSSTTSSLPSPEITRPESSSLYEQRSREHKAWNNCLCCKDISLPIRR